MNKLTDSLDREKKIVVFSRKVYVCDASKATTTTAIIYQSHKIPLIAVRSNLLPVLGTTNNRFLLLPFYLEKKTTNRWNHNNNNNVRLYV